MEIEGVDLLTARVNYLIGNDPKRWHRDVPTYSRVRYRDVWPGVDVIYYGDAQTLEYDFVVAPRAAPDAIRIAIDGAETSIDHAGNLVLQTAAGKMTLRRPSIYQQLPDGAREAIAGRFLLRPRGGRAHSSMLSVALARYDRSRTLVVDPQLVYSSYLGGSGGTSEFSNGDGAADIAVDSSGNFYAAGFAYSTDFPAENAISMPPMSSDPAASNDTPVAFIAKFNPKAGDANDSLIYSTYLGGSGNAASQGAEGDDASGIAVDGSGNAYVTGTTFSADFPTTKGAFRTTNPQRSSSQSAAFVAEIDPTGGNLVYSTFLGGQNGNMGARIALKPGCLSDCDAYVAGSTNSRDFPTQNAFQDTFNRYGRSEAFVTVVAAGGGSLRYSTFLGGSGTLAGGDSANSIAVDSSGRNAYVTGSTYSSDFPTLHAFQTVNRAVRRAEENAFVAKLDTSGGPGSLVWSTLLGGSGSGSGRSPGRHGFHSDIGEGVAVDSSPSPNVFVTGLTFSRNFPTTKGAFQTTNRAAGRGGANAFLSEISSDGSTLVYSTCLGGSGGLAGIGDIGLDLAVDSQGHAYVAGTANSTDLPVTANACQTRNRSKAGDSNVFVTELDPRVKPARKQLVWSSYFGGSFVDEAGGVAVGATGDVYVAGATASLDLPIALANAFQPNHATNPVNLLNAFVAELNPSGGCGRLLVTPATVNFGRVGAHKNASKPLTIKNRGSDVLYVEIVSELNAPFSLRTASATFTLTPGETLTPAPEIQFAPLSAGRFTSQTGGIVFIRSDDMMRTLESVSVVGIGTTPRP